MAEQRADKEKTAFCQTNEELAVQAQAGDKGAISQLWNQTRGIIFMILARYYNRNPERFARCGVTMDDLEQEGFFAVLEAVEAFNPAKGWKFTSWLNYPLQNHVNAILGTRSGQIKHIPLNECSSLDEPISQESLLPGVTSRSWFPFGTSSAFALGFVSLDCDYSIHLYSCNVNRFLHFFSCKVAQENTLFFVQYYS